MWFSCGTVGAKCGDYVSGQGSCTDGSSDCGIYGVCRSGKCNCGSGFGCARCEAAKSQLVAGTATCSCAGVDCSGHGACHNGLCVCNDGYAGSQCEFDPCAGNDCSGHGTCSRSTGKCTCTDGYAGDDCSTGGSVCEEDKHCGIFGDYSYGGSCNEEGNCDCKDGYTCADCSGIGTYILSPCTLFMSTFAPLLLLLPACLSVCLSVCRDHHSFALAGDECATARGGGPCSSAWDCGVFPTGFGGECVFTDSDKYWITEGRCRCWPGLTCQQCNVKTSDRDAGAVLGVGTKQGGMLVARCTLLVAHTPPRPVFFVVVRLAWYGLCSFIQGWTARLQLGVLRSVFVCSRLRVVP